MLVAVAALALSANAANLAEVVCNAESWPELTTLCAAAGASPDALEVLTGDDDLTLLAPTNAAFDAINAFAGFDIVNEFLLLEENADALFQVLAYHLVPGNVLAADLANGPVATAQGEDLMIVGVPDAPGFMDKFMRKASVVTADIESPDNGVIHTISNVVIPDTVKEVILEATASVAVKVSVSNLMQNAQLTPIFAAAHPAEWTFVDVTAAPDMRLALLAEGGDPSGYAAELSEAGGSYSSAPGLLFPGMTMSTVVLVSAANPRLSFGSMLLPTNDAFIAQTLSVDSPAMGFLYAFDAGTELNSELCADIPGPTCMGEPYNAAPGEGFVYVHTGIQGDNEVSAAYDFAQPVAKYYYERL